MIVPISSGYTWITLLSLYYNLLGATRRDSAPKPNNYYHSCGGETIFWILKFTGTSHIIGRNLTSLTTLLLYYWIFKKKEFLGLVGPQCDQVCVITQVYMVTMEEEKQHEKQKLQNNGKSTEDGEDVDEFGELVTGNESLLSLVQPEVKMLSKHWLAVLKWLCPLVPPTRWASIGWLCWRTRPHCPSHQVSKHLLVVLSDHALLSLPPGEQALVGCAEVAMPYCPSHQVSKHWLVVLKWPCPIVPSHQVSKHLLVVLSGHALLSLPSSDYLLPVHIGTLTLFRGHILKNRTNLSLSWEENSAQVWLNFLIIWLQAFDGFICVVN